MNDKEKIEEALKLIHRYNSNPPEYSPSLTLGEIKKILES